MISISILFLLTFVSASPIQVASRRGNSAPTVAITNGTIIGTTSGSIDSFKGIPFAQPPVGPLRLRPPQPLMTSFGIFTSLANPNSCPQFLSQITGGSLPDTVLGMLNASPLFQQITEQSEDCLNLNVQRPSSTTSSSKLPVVVWFFGGAFEFGSTQLYDGAGIISKSVALKQPIIYVSVNYRLGGFGFLPGKEMQADGSTNLGLKDQRLALQWVQENIAAFGGDPSKVCADSRSWPLRILKIV